MRKRINESDGSLPKTQLRPFLLPFRKLDLLQSYSKYYLRLGYLHTWWQLHEVKWKMIYYPNLKFFEMTAIFYSIAKSEKQQLYSFCKNTQHFPEPQYSQLIIGATLPENERITFKSLLIFYFIIKHMKSEKNIKYCVDGAEVNLEVVLYLEYTILQVLIDTILKALHY